LSEYRIFETDEFRHQLAQLASEDAEFIRNKLRGYVYPQLRRAPHVGPQIKKLRGYRPETWRYRIGKFRVFYLIDEKAHVVSVLTVDRRRDAYR
jgi:mRNA interferase RelE/StbE